MRWIGASLFLFWLTGCGGDYCVLGMGPCKGGKDKPVDPVSDPLTLVTPPSYVLLNETVTFVTTGGAPPVTFSLEQGGGVLTPLDTRTARYVAPAVAGSVTIRVKDARAKSLDWAFVVRVRP